MPAPAQPPLPEPSAQGRAATWRGHAARALVVALLTGPPLALLLSPAAALLSVPGGEGLLTVRLFALDAARARQGMPIVSVGMGESTRVRLLSARATCLLAGTPAYAPTRYVREVQRGRWGLIPQALPGRGVPGEGLTRLGEVTPSASRGGRELAEAATQLKADGRCPAWVRVHPASPLDALM